MSSSLIWIPKRLVELGLLNVAAMNAQALIQYCEQDYAARVAYAAAEIQKSGVRVVMLTGPSSSGKTTTANKIAQQLRTAGVTSAVISLDNFFKDVEQYPRLPNGQPDYESVDALDIEAVNSSLQQLSKTGKAQIPDFDFGREKRRQGMTQIDVGQGVAVVEGIHALNPRLIELLPAGSVYRVYAGLREEYSMGGQRILPTRDIRLARRMVRDKLFRGHTPEQTMAMWQAVCEGEDRNIKVFKQEADLLLDTSFTYEPCCLAGVVHSMAQTVDAASSLRPAAEDLARRFALCSDISHRQVPRHSMLREFLGQEGSLPQ